MAFKMKNEGIKKIVGELRKASKTHAGQADRLESMSAMKMKKEDKQVPLSAYEKKKGTEITGGNKAERINDLEDRIEFLQSDLKEGKGDITQLKILRAKLAQLKKS
tara:strand:+ start:248 stop:565 length:318 start_codon:yes stop_codon:yes gene_type:complete